MNIHEYQAKALLREAGALVSEGRAITDASEAKAAAEELGGPVWVVKSQIHAGGRGKGTFKGAEDQGGGVRVVKSIDEVVSNAGAMLGQTLVTHQTGGAGKQVNTLYIEDGATIKREMYLSLLVDRETSRISFIASTEGGMDIEEVAAKTPEKILTLDVDPATGIRRFHGLRLAAALKMEGQQVKQMRRADRPSLQFLHRQGLLTAGDQPARHRRRRTMCACWTRR